MKDDNYSLLDVVFEHEYAKDAMCDQAVSMIDSFYISKEKVSALLADRFGSSYPEEHPDEVIALTTLLEYRSVAWSSLLWQRDSFISLEDILTGTQSGRK